MDKDLFIMIAIVVFIGCGAGVANNALNVVRGFLEKKLKIEELRARNSEAALQETMRHAREEIGQLGQSTHDLILSFDSTLQRLDDRLQSVERIALKAEALPGSLPSAVVAPARIAAPSVERTVAPDVGPNGARADG